MSQSMSDLVRVNLKQPRYDQGTFWGRFRHFVDVTDVRTTLSTQKQIDDALKTLADYQKAGCPAIPRAHAEEIWAAKKLKDATIHSDTGEKIFLPFRFAAFVPVNVVVCAGLLIPGASTPTVMFWQWMNQSYNLALNHANRNASNQLSNQQIAVTYVGAVAISCGVAVGLGQLVKRASFLSASTKSTLGTFVPFTAAACAGVANVFLMRGNEMSTGITVLDRDDKPLGKSKTAGLHALTQVSISRICTSFACLSVPPIILAGVMRPKWVQQRPNLHLPITLTVIGATMLTCLPAAIAVFPQVCELPVSKMEPEFQNLKDSKGPIDKVYYNRGL